MDASYCVYVDLHPQRSHRYASVHPILHGIADTDYRDRGPDIINVASIPRCPRGNIHRVARQRLLYEKGKEGGLGEFEQLKRCTLD
jgi:hypothetical protein